MRKTGEAGKEIVEPDLKPESPYKFSETGKHFFILAIPADKGNTGSLKIQVSNFNGEFYRNDRLALQDAPLGNSMTLLVVRSFDDLEKAKIYLAAFSSKKAEDKLGKIASEFKFAVISTSNFTTLFKLKDFEQYLKYYNSNY